MPSTARLFSKTLFKQNIRRFWPLLAAYLFLVIIVGFAFMKDINSYHEITSAIFINYIFNTSSLFTLVIAFFSIAIGAAVYSYIHNTTAVAMVNTLPYKRKTVYISNYLSGLFILLIPLLVFFLVLAGIGWQNNCLEYMGLLKWLFIFTALSVLLYSLAVSIGMLTGHIIAHIVFYGIANLFFIGLYTMIDLLLGSFLYGYTGMSSIEGLMGKATPVLYGVRLNYYNGTIGGSIWVWAIYLLMGVLLTWAGYKLYEKRKMENAGDVVAIRKLNPLFKYGVAFCSSLVFGLVLTEMFNIRHDFFWSLLLLIFAGAVGYFTAEMLLRKTYRVFDAYKGLLIYTFILIIAAASIYNDWYGYAARMPNFDQVEAIAFANDGLSYNAIYTLQADKSIVHLEIVPNLPESLALTYGTPIERVENLDGSYRYIYQETQNLNPEETRLFWSMVPGIYLENGSLEKIQGLHEYLSEHIGEIRNAYRQRDTSEWFQSQEHPVSHYDIKLIYRFDDGKTSTYNFPVIMPKEIITNLDKDIYGQLVSLAGSPERRAKKIAAIDIPTENIRHIHIDQSIMKYTEKHPPAREEFAVPHLVDGGQIKINPEDYGEIINALQADYLSMTDEEMLKLNYTYIGYVSFSLENLNLPPENGFRDRSFSLDIDFNHKNTLEFLYSKDYIEREVYDLIQEYAKLASNPQPPPGRIDIASR